LLSPAAVEREKDADVDLADTNTFELAENEETGYYSFKYSCRSFPSDMSSYFGVSLRLSNA